MLSDSGERRIRLISERAAHVEFLRQASLQRHDAELKEGELPLEVSGEEPKSLPFSDVRVCRQASETDLKDVLALKTSATSAMFGDVDIAALIERGVCKCLLNSKKELVGFLAVQDHPNCPVLSQCSWENWIRRYYRMENCTPWNTLFIHYLVWDTRYPDFFLQFLKSFYKNSVQLEQFLMVVPPGIKMFQELAPYFTEIFSKGIDTWELAGVGAQTVHLNLRLSVVNKLIVRKAGEEDNIDVQPILQIQYDILKKVFGDFRLGNVIDLKDKNKAIIVAERTSEVTVGVMALTSDIDYQHVEYFFFVPLRDFHKQDRIGWVRSEISKQTQSSANRHISQWFAGFATDESLKPISPEVFKGVEADKESVTDLYYVVQRESSMPEVFLEDDKNEFRIVDPAIEYLLFRRRLHTPINSISDSVLGSVLSIDYSTYHGRPSWSMPPCSPSVCAIPKEELSKKDSISTFSGPKNGFTISMFALHPDLDTRYSFDLLEAAFECYRDKEYCLMSLPTDYQGSPLTRHFVRLTPRMSRDFPHELYLIHRNSIFSEFKVRRASRVDYTVLRELVENLPQGRRITKDITSLVFQGSPGNHAFVLECEGCIIGLAVVSEQFDLQQLEPHYRLEEVVRLSQHDWQGHGLLKHAVVSAAFLRASSFFLRQLMHQIGLSTLSYCMLSSDVMVKLDMSTATVLNDLIPVPPRKRIVYDLSALTYNAPEEHMMQQEHEFVLFITTEKHLSIPKLELNYRIVVVGASDTGLSFLEHLIFRSAKKYIVYNNLTLISPHGTPLELNPHEAGDRMLPHSGHYTRDYLARLGLKTHINVLYGTVTVINRKEKMICLNDNHWLRYDYLFLFTGLQFCKPTPVTLGPQKTESCRRFEDERTLHSVIARECGDNVFLVNTTADCTIALGSFKKIVTSRQRGKVVVYGNCINMYTCIEALLKFGVPGNRIVLVESPDTCKLRGLDNNTVIEKAVLQSLEHLGVTLHLGYSLVNWTLRHKRIHKVLFCMDTNVPLTIACLSLFCFGPKTMSAKTHTAITDARIVYTDGIIIDSKFRTNDEFIYAAGPGTKYSRRYQKPQADHENFSSLEVGMLASEIFRKEVEPQLPGLDGPTHPKDRLPLMKEPVTLVAQLPGGWNYLLVSAPGRPLPLECQLHGQGDSGPVLITGDPVDPEGPGYFQLSLSVHNTVREIACLTKKEIPYQNLQCLYGKHEKLLNNLSERYNLGLVHDFYAFFSQPWAYALYTTGFPNLLLQCSNVFMANEDAGMTLVQQMEEGKCELGPTNDGSSDKGLFPEISQMYSLSSVPHYVEHLTSKYTSERHQLLPMYLTDAFTSEMIRAYSTSPLHRKRKHIRTTSQE